MNRLKAIIFDMDGTLADTEEIHRQAFNAAFDKFNIPCQWDQHLYKSLLSISGGRERIKQYFIENNLMPDHQGTINDLALSIHQTKSEMYRQMLIDGHVGLRIGVERLIEEAKQKNITMAIATSSSTINVETLLKSTLGSNALDLFESIITCDIVENKKPSPAVYEHVLKKIRLCSSDCVALEDTFNGNKAALSADIATVITTHFFTLEDNFDGASLVINHLGEQNLPMTVQFGESYAAKFVDIQLLELILEDKYQRNTCKKTATITAEQ
ncbi:MAG: HAD superfamily hydrolase (TIGR01509 family) [Gammaproteobacteria bacterium]|jgi:HAD superfamily hydrolase (TIGR01509 family)